MNTKQRRVIMAAIVLVALCGLVVPYEGELAVDYYGGPRGPGQLGYYLVITPPNLYYARNAHIAVPQVLIPIGTICLVALGVVYLLGDPARKAPAQAGAASEPEKKGETA